MNVEMKDLPYKGVDDAQRAERAENLLRVAGECLSTTKERLESWGRTAYEINSVLAHIRRYFGHVE